MALKINSQSRVKKQQTTINYNKFPLAPANFIRMAIAGALIIAGFLLMTGGANEGAVFNEDIFSVRRIVVGPGVAFIGFVYMAFAINYKKRKSTKNDEMTESEDVVK